MPHHTQKGKGSAGVWQDQQVRHANERAGWTLCSHCSGTGNELCSMYRACPECGGSGHIGEPPLRVRLSHWIAERKHRFKMARWDANPPKSPGEVPAWIRRGLGIGADGDGLAAWAWAGRLRWALSYYLGIGQWFKDGRDVCHRCDALPSDVDFLMRRVGPRKTECLERKLCDEAVEEILP